MKIRFAREADIPACIDVGKQIYQLSRFQRFAAYQPDKVATSLQQVLNGAHQGNYCFLVAESSTQQIAGGLIGRMEKHMFADIYVASTLFYGVLPQYRMTGAAIKLLYVYRQWAQKRKAAELMVGINSGYELARTDRFLKRMKFELAGGNYCLPLASG